MISEDKTPNPPTLRDQIAAEKAGGNSSLTFATVVSIKDAAKMLGVSYSTFHRLAASGKIGPLLQVSLQRKVVPLEVVEKYLNDCYQKSTQRGC